MTISIGQIVIWVIIGALAGSLASMLLRGRRQGLARFRDVLLGMVGAVVGAALFRLLNIDLGLEDFNISAEDLLSAFIGSLIVLGIMALIQRRRRA